MNNKVSIVPVISKTIKFEERILQSKDQYIV